MTETDDVFQHHDLVLRPDPDRTVVRPFAPEYPPAFAHDPAERLRIIAGRVESLDDEQVVAEGARLKFSLDDRFRDVDGLLDRRFAETCALLPGTADLHVTRRRLIAAYLCGEYSFESAALFNPSAAIAKDQSGVADGSVRFVLSLRGIGEGHVSSVTFRTGIWTPGGDIVIDEPSRTAVPPTIERPAGGDTFAVRINCQESRDFSETVLFPVLPSQRQGIEDLRLVQFTEDDGRVVYYGTYTAFSGTEAKSEMLHGIDLRSFDLQPMTGDAAQAKGMALFPRRVGGRYMMLGRQDNENIWVLASDDLFHWEGGTKVVEPKFPWEFVQMGNCGSPIEIDEGWLVLTHGVGAVRNYSMGACLLDKEDPTKLLARTPLPILEPRPEERNGYVPNVVYSCGSLVVGRDLLLPYGVADNFTAFATTTVDRLLAAMT